MVEALAYDYVLKIVVVGNSKAGKTAFLERYCNDVFIPSYVSTVGVDFRLRSVLRYE